MGSKIWSKLILASLCVMLRPRVLRTYILGLAIRVVLGLGDRAGGGEGGGVGGGGGGRGVNEIYVMDG